MKKLLLLAAAACIPVLPLTAKITLAEGGKTLYRVVLPEKPEKIITEAGKDLRMTLCKITGAGFKYGSWKDRKEHSHRLFVGIKAPGDTEPMARRERRVRTVGNDIYFYGATGDDCAFAVYDFLESIGCRWYTVRGRSFIPAIPELKLENPDITVVPTFFAPKLTGGSHVLPKTLLEKYARRNRIYATNSTGGDNRIGPDYSHVPGKLIPPGNEFKKQINLWMPYKYSVNDRYFATNPEYFSLNAKGKRVPDKQLCYSNPGARKLLTAKFLEIIAKEYKGGPASMRCDLNDNNGFENITICYCKGCMELVKKYDSPAGPYWDYTVEFCNMLAEKYPQIYIISSAYLSTEKPPKIDKLPDNLYINLAPLNKSYTKPYDHKDNANIINRLKAWKRLCKNMTAQLYPSIYVRATTTLPLLANLRQLAQNLRICKQFGLVNVTGEQGHPWAVFGGFNELRQYMLSRMLNNADLDENKIIEEYMRFIYGSAADNMISYWQELERLEAAEDGCTINWYGLNIDTLSYLTRENLIRWSRLFDTMEKQTAGEPEALAAVREARTNLDEAILAARRRTGMPDTPEFDPAVLGRRVRRTIRNSLNVMRKHYANGSIASRRINSAYNRQVLNGVNFVEALARTPKTPLPDEFRKYKPENIIRTLPGKCTSGQVNNICHIPEDSKAPFGVYLKGTKKAENRMIRVGHSCIIDKTGQRYLVAVGKRKEHHSSVFRKHPGEYRYYYFGRTRLFRTHSLFIHTFDHRRDAWVQLGQYFNPEKPEIEYDIYLAIEPSADGCLNVAEVVLATDGKQKIKQEVIRWAAAG